jgi:hypothetical protein
MVLIIISVLDVNNFKFKIKQKLVSGFIFVLGVMIIFYVALPWSDFGSTTIWGVREDILFHLPH